MDLGLSNRVAIVAGGSRGCGYGIATALASEGAKVVLSGRQADVVVTAAEKLRAGGASVPASAKSRSVA